jgi:hypothetical protein
MVRVVLDLTLVHYSLVDILQPFQQQQKNGQVQVPQLVLGLQVEI